MVSVREWTGREAAALRRALRLSVRAFAEYLGVAARTVAKWEALGTVTQPRPDTQAILDTALDRAGTAVQTRFEQFLTADPETGSRGPRWLGDPRAWGYETWADDLERVAVRLSHQKFPAAQILLGRWLGAFEPAGLDTKGLFLHARSLMLQADMRRDQGVLHGPNSARQSYRQALDIFSELNIARRVAQSELSLTIVMEMSGALETAAHRYQVLTDDERLSDRDRARARLWIGTALSKNGRHHDATRAMVTAVEALESLGEHEDWSVAQQKLALAYRGGGDLDRAQRHIDVALCHGAGGAPLHQVRLTTAHAHILLSDTQTSDAGLRLLDTAEELAVRHGMAHQVNSVRSIRHGFESASEGHQE